MPKQLEFEGRPYDFPDEASDDQIASFLKDESARHAPSVRTLAAQATQDSGVAIPAPGPTRVGERMGGNIPNLPRELQRPAPQVPTGGPRMTFRPTVPIPPPGPIESAVGKVGELGMRAIGAVAGMPAEGGSQVGQGVHELAQPGMRSKAQGASDIIRGGMTAVAPFALPAGVFAGPAAAAGGLIVGAGAQYGTEKGLELAGVPEEYRNLAGDVAGLAAGGMTAHRLMPKPSAIPELPRIPETPRAPIEQVESPMVPGSEELSPASASTPTPTPPAVPKPRARIPAITEQAPGGLLEGAELRRPVAPTPTPTPTPPAIEPPSLAASVEAPAPIASMRQEPPAAAPQTSVPAPETPDAAALAPPTSRDTRVADLSHAEELHKSPPFLDKVHAFVAPKVARVQSLMLREKPLRDEFPSAWNSIRLAKDLPTDASRESAGQIYEVLKPLTEVDKPAAPEARRLLEDLVWFRDFVSRSGKGHDLPGGMKGEEAQGTLAALQAKLAEQPSAVQAAINDSLQRYDQLTQTVGKEMASRGKYGMKPEDAENPWAPHSNTEFKSALKDLGIGKGSRGGAAKEAYRAYEITPFGSTRPIKLDLVDVLHNRLSQYHFDNANDAWIQGMAAKYDAVPKLPAETLVGMTGATGKVEPGKLYLDPNTNTPYRGFNFGDKTHLLPARIANTLEQLRKPEEAILPIEALQSATRYWKNQAVTVPFLGFNFRNFLSGVMTLGQKDLGQIKHIPQAMKAAFSPGAELNPLTTQAVALAGRQRVIGGSGTMIGELGAGNDVTHPLANPSTRGMTTWSEFASHQLPLMTQLRQLAARVEAGPRIAGVMGDLERQGKGKGPAYLYNPPKDFISGPDPLSPEELIGWNNRTAFVDYREFSDEFDKYGPLAMPFIKWSAKNLVNQGRWAKSHPGKAIGAVAAPAAALWGWNNGLDKTGNWESRQAAESRMPEYISRHVLHLQTGQVDKDGKDIVIMIDDPIDAAAKMVGLSTIPDYAGKVARGEMPVDRAVAGAIKEMPTEARDTMLDMLNPLVKGPLEAAAGTKFLSSYGGPIGSDKEMNSSRATEIRLTHVLKTLFSSYGQYKQNEKKPQSDADNFWEVVGKPVDVPSALGIKRVDATSSQLSKSRDETNQLQRGLNDKTLMLHDAWVDSGGQSSNPIWKAALKKAYNDPGPSPSAQQIQDMVKTPSMQLDILRKKIRDTTDRPTHDALMVQYRAMQQAARAQQEKSLPSTVRGAKRVGNAPRLPGLPGR